MLAKSAGIPHWDKARVSKGNANAAQARNGEAGAFVFIPFVRTTGSRTNAILVVSANAEDTLFKLIYSSQYFTYPFEQAEEGEYWKAKDIFHAFLIFDRDIFSYKKFKVFDERLVGRPYDSSKYTTLEFTPAPPVERVDNYYYQTECIQYTSCGSCGEARPETANIVFCCDPIILTTCVTYYFSTVDDDDWGWVGSGGGINGESGGGGNDDDTSWVGEDPCEDPDPSEPAFEFCDDWGGGGGWEPELEFDPDMAAPIIVDSSITDNYPCLDTLIKGMINPNKTAQKFLHDVFGADTKMNLTFAVDTSLTENDDPGYTLPSSGLMSSIPGGTIFHDTIYLNDFFIENASKEFIVSVIYHEAIHAYIDYYYNLYEEGYIDSTEFKIKFPLFWSQYSGVTDVSSGLYALAQHQQMAASYRDSLENLIVPYYNPSASVFFRKKGLSALAWGGLRNTLAWNELGSDTCNIIARIAAAGEYGMTKITNHGACTSIISHSDDMMLSPPCN
jgi:hypothetical protein